MLVGKWAMVFRGMLWQYEGKLFVLHRRTYDSKTSSCNDSKAIVKLELSQGRRQWSQGELWVLGNFRQPRAGLLIGEQRDKRKRKLMHEETEKEQRCLPRLSEEAVSSRVLRSSVPGISSKVSMIEGSDRST